MTTRTFLLILSLCSTAELCVRTIPPEEVFITTTELPAEELCTKCNIDDIKPVLDDAEVTKFTATEDAADGQCKMTTVVCERTDFRTCDSVTMSAQSPSGTTSIGTTSTPTSVTSQLTCAADGTYSWNAVTGITQLSCNFVNCVPPSQCTNCNIDDIKPVLDDAEVTKFTATEDAADGQCKMTTVVCERTDFRTCDSVTMSAQSPSGTTSIGTTSTPTSVTSQLTCAADGTYSWNAVTGITQLSCNFVNCVPPSQCTNCNIDAIAPGMAAGTSFASTELAAAGACKQTEVMCQRTDGMTCDVTIKAGNLVIDTAMASTQVSAILDCQADGTYSYLVGMITGITSLSCEFENCVAPCPACDLTGKVANSQNPAIMVSIEDAPGCMKKATCSYEGATACSLNRMVGTPFPGLAIVSTETTTTTNSALISCSADGKYESNGYTSLTLFQCQMTCTPSTG